MFVMTDIKKPQVNKTLPSHVLVIDDDDAMIEMLKQVLEPDDFVLSVASTGQMGIENARKLAPDVIILDLLVPEMDGWQVCKSIREFSLAPILVLSAISKPGMVAKALDEGADDYLLKPVTSSVLVAHIKRLAWRARAEREANGHNYNFLGI
jgi:DNA-binding response OmpR family regulator